MALEGADVAEDVCRRHREVERELGGQIDIGKASDTVGPEQLTHVAHLERIWTGRITWS